LGFRGLAVLFEHGIGFHEPLFGRFIQLRQRMLGDMLQSYFASMERVYGIQQAHLDLPQTVQAAWANLSTESATMGPIGVIGIKNVLFVTVATDERPENSGI
jgi:hypothetical protein